MAQVMMQRETKTMEKDEFIFPQGLAGFGASHRFGFIYQGVGNMVCMQSLEQPEAAFILTPWDKKRLGKTPQLTIEQQHCLQIEDDAVDDVLWMLVLNPFADKKWVTANLRAPIALHIDACLGVQCISQDADLPLRYRWMEQPKP